jgi:hypothetical protein
MQISPVKSLEVTKTDPARVKLLWDLSSERRNQGRHSENLRATVAAQTVAGASALVAVITYDKHVDIYDLPLCLMVTFVGIVGALFSATYTERYHRNRKRASDLLKELDAVTPHDNRLSTIQIEARADEQTWSKKRFSIIRKISSTHWLWLVFPTIVTAVGVALSFFAIACGQCAPTR